MMKHDGTTRPPRRWRHPPTLEDSAAPAPRIDMPPRDSGESIGSFWPHRATHLARAQVSESTGFSESWRGIMRLGERRGLVAIAIPGGSTSAFRKPPRIPVGPLLTSKDNLEGGLPKEVSLIGP